MFCTHFGTKSLQSNTGSVQKKEAHRLAGILPPGGLLHDGDDRVKAVATVLHQLLAVPLHEELAIRKLPPGICRVAGDVQMSLGL